MASPVGTSRPVSAPAWIVAVLNGIHAPVTQTNVAALNLWALEEGNGAPRYNWLNTTLKTHGSTQAGIVKGSPAWKAGVRTYPSFQAGVDATVQTLQGFPMIVGAFQRTPSTLQGIYEAIQQSTYCGSAGCAAIDPGYPQTFQMGNANVATAAAIVTASGPNSSGPTNGCASKVGSNPGAPHNIFTIPHTSTGLTYCNLKAILGGMMVLGGGILCMTALAFIVVGEGLSRGSPAMRVVQTAQRIGGKGR